MGRIRIDMYRERCSSEAIPEPTDQRRELMWLACEACHCLVRGPGDGPGLWLCPGVACCGGRAVIVRRRGVSRATNRSRPGQIG